MPLLPRCSLPALLLSTSTNVRSSSHLVSHIPQLDDFNTNDIDLAWGKRDYACINVYQGIPDNSTVSAGQTVHLLFNRAPTTHCTDPLAKYPGSNYTVFLYNNPVRNLDTIHFDAQIKIAGDIPESAGKVDVKIPKVLPQVKDGSVWYLRLDTSLPTAPQVCNNVGRWLFFGGLWIGLMLVNDRCLLCTTLPDRLLLPPIR